MPADYRTVRLMKNRLYPTYQLHAVMAARKTTPEDGLKIGVLTILDWLRHRLGPDAPETLTAPQPEQYADFSWENLRSLYINQGYVIDIVSLPEQGAWTMQIVEPDLGSDPSAVRLCPAALLKAILRLPFQTESCTAASAR